MSSKPVPVSWIHNDPRGKVDYPSIKDFAAGLNITYSTAQGYIKKGYAGDSDLPTMQKQLVTKRATFAAILKKKGVGQ